MKKIIQSMACISLSSIAATAIANPSSVIFSGESIYAQPIKVSLVKQDSNQYRLILTVLDFDQKNGRSYQSTEIANNLNCDIQELTSVSCEAITPEGEAVKFYTKNTENVGRYLVALESNGAPFPLGFSMVWETR